MHFLLDQNVPDSVANFLRDQNYKVHLVRDILLPGSPDQLIAMISEEKGWILVSADHDFEKIAPRIPTGAKTRFKKLSRISLQCGEHQAAQRLKEFMPYIEMEYKRTRGMKDSRMLITIQNSGFKINR